MADPGSEKRGGDRGFGALPPRFLVNFSQFRGLFKVFAENMGGGGRTPPAPPSGSSAGSAAIF